MRALRRGCRARCGGGVRCGGVRRGGGVRWDRRLACLVTLAASSVLHCGTSSSADVSALDASSGETRDAAPAPDATVAADELVADGAAKGGNADSRLDDASSSADVASAPDRVAEAAADAEAPPAPPLPYERPNYRHLSETGLLATANSSGRSVTDAVDFVPAHQLWSDGATKRRWLRLPPGTAIDTTDMDHWVFPVGTKLWKEFSLGGVLLETRLIERYGSGPDDYWMGTFVWNGEQSDAEFAPEGALDLHGTAHDAPAQKLCGSCHRGETGRVLGFSAMQMAPGSNVARPSLLELHRNGLLSSPAREPVGVPGDAATAAALGYLHANCGHCHNDRGTAWPDTQMVLRLRVDERDPEATELYRSLVGVPLQFFRGGEIGKRVTPGHPEASGVVTRMQSREAKVGMPPLASETPDDAGLAIVRRWISSLSP